MQSTFKKTLLISLLAGAGIAAHAEGFGFYALIDGGIASTAISGGKAKTGTTTEFITGGFAPNFFGLTAEKSLGDGYTGGVKLEQGFLLNATDSQSYAFGGNTIFNRQANLYVKGSSGTLVVGTQSNFAFDSVLFADPRSGSNYGSSLATVDIDGALGTIEKGAISYKSPSMNGFTLGAEFTSKNNTSTVATRDGNAVSLTYSQAALGATLASYQAQAVGTSGTVGGLTYNLGALTLKGIALNQKTPTYNSLNTTGVGGNYVYTPTTTFDFGAYTSKDSKSGYNTNTYAAGVYYKFLKDLTVYGQYANVKNSGTPSAASNFTWSSNANFIATGQTASSVNVGLLFGFF